MRFKRQGLCDAHSRSSGPNDHGHGPAGATLPATGSAAHRPASGAFDAGNEFRTAVARADKNARYRVRWGRLLQERFNDKDAADMWVCVG